MMGSPRDPKELPKAVSRRLSAAKNAPDWVSPPDDLVEGLLSSEERPPAPPAGESEWTLEWQVTDVRGGEVGAEGAHVISQVFEGGELALTADPPQGDRGWRVRGTVWIRDPEPGSVQVILLLEDHVVTSATVVSGEPFSLEEFLSPGWSLEVRLPNGKTVSIADPAV